MIFCYVIVPAIGCRSCAPARHSCTFPTKSNEQVLWQRLRSSYGPCMLISRRLMQGSEGRCLLWAMCDAKRLFNRDVQSNMKRQRRARTLLLQKVGRMALCIPLTGNCTGSARRAGVPNPEILGCCLTGCVAANSSKQGFAFSEARLSHYFSIYLKI